MRYDCLKEFKDEEFRRLTGVKRSTFEKMVDILKEAESSKKLLGGRPNRLSIEDQLLMALEYIREYRTYFHVGASYQISESACYRNIRWIEDVLIKHPDFALP
ncbi:MAG: transposase family protein, partial [Candidatus Rhabdochlamydia sp.]